MKKIVFALVLWLAAAAAAVAQIEETLPIEPGYDLSRFRILTIAADGFNYEETVEMSALWREMGARVDYAGPKRELAGEKGGPGDGPEPGAEAPTLRVDHLLSEIDASGYDLIYFAGGEGIGGLVRDHGTTIRGLIGKAHARKAFVAAICHAPMLLTVTPLIKGMKVTANGDSEIRALQDAGATVVDDVLIRDGVFLTGQYPFLRSFAFHAAETLLYPGGNGPLQKYLAARPPLEKALDGLRNVREFSEWKASEKDLETILGSAFKTFLMQPWGNYPPLFKLARIGDGKARQALAEAIAGQLKAHYQANFGSPARIDEHVRRCFVNPPELFLVFIDTKAAGPAGSPFRDMMLRAAVARYGSALENIALTAGSLGLGVGLLGFPPLMQSAEKAVRDQLALPETMMFIDMFAIGYPLRSNPPAISRPLSALMLDGRPE